MILFVSLLEFNKNHDLFRLFIIQTIMKGVSKGNNPNNHFVIQA